MTASELLFEGRCYCGHTDSRHDHQVLTSNARARAAVESDTYPCEDCGCSDYGFKTFSERGA